MFACFPQYFFQTVAIEAGLHGALGEEGNDAGNADLRGFLHDELEIFALQDGAKEGDLLDRFAVGSVDVFERKADLGFAHIKDHRFRFAPLAVAEDERIADLEPENVAPLVDELAVFDGELCCIEIEITDESVKPHGDNIAREPGSRIGVRDDEKYGPGTALFFYQFSGLDLDRVGEAKGALHLFC